MASPDGKKQVYGSGQNSLINFIAKFQYRMFGIKNSVSACIFIHQTKAIYETLRETESPKMFFSRSYFECV